MLKRSETSAVRPTSHTGRLASVHAAIQHQAEQNPDAWAVRCGPAALTYGDLEAQAAALVPALRAAGARPGDVVALRLPRSTELVVAMYAVLKSGSAVLLLDPRWPDTRQEHALVASEARILLGAGPTSGIPALAPETWPSGATAYTDVPIPATAAAYVVFTSGSTGRPKGVVVEHGGLENLVRWHRTALRVTAGTRVGSTASIGFDAFHWDVWSTLAAGATLHLSPGGATTAAGLAQWYDEDGIDIGFVPSSLAAQVCSELSACGARTQTVLTGGDRLVLDHTPLPGPTLINAYGPSECTVVATWTTVEPDTVHGTEVSIGSAIDNVSVYVLGPDLEPVPDGSMGEIYIAGGSVGGGYFGEPAATAARFLPNPWQPGRLFRTGDFAVRAAGRLWFCGRGDRQVQVGGVRVEPNEVETALVATGLVTDCRVDLVQNLKTGRGVLRARCLVGNEVAADQVRAAARHALPPAMVPSLIETATYVPLTSNDKTDWSAFEPGAAPTSPSPRPTTEDPLTTLVARSWAQHLGLDPAPAPAPDDDFFSLGGDSLAAIELTTFLERELGRELGFDLIFQHPNFGGFVDAVRRDGAP